MAHSIPTTEIIGESVITDVPVLDANTPLTDDTKMYLDIEQTFRQIPLSRLFNWLKGKMTLAVYPIGSVYMTFSGSNPATMFGGMWEKIENTFLLAASSNYPVNSVNGSNTVTLTTANLPSHSHSGTTNGTSLTTSSNSHSHTPSNSNYLFTLNKNISGVGTDVERKKTKMDSSSDRFTMTSQNLDSIYQATNTNSVSHSHTISSHKHTFTTNNVGSGRAINIMPRYRAVYVWRRIG